MCTTNSDTGVVPCCRVLFVVWLCVEDFGSLGFFFFFFFNDTATTEIYTLSLHDALPIFSLGERRGLQPELFNVSVKVQCIGISKLLPDP